MRDEKRYYRNRKNTRFYILWGERMVCEMNNTVADEGDDAQGQKPQKDMAVGMSVYKANSVKWHRIQEEIENGRLLTTNEAMAREFMAQLRNDMPKIIDEAGLNVILPVKPGRLIIKQPMAGVNR